MRPFFSIIIATYNRSDLIPKSIQSVLDQDFINWELIIIDDGSTDNTPEIIKEQFQDLRIRYSYQKNSGRSAARNLGIEKSKGEYICFLDSDDYYLPDHLSSFHNLINKNNGELGFYFCNTYEEYKGVLTKIPSANFSGNNYEYIFKCPIGTPRVCLPKELLNRERFNTSLSVGEDVELWMRLLPIKLLTHGKYTEVYLSHDDRSIANGKVEPVIEDYKLKKGLLKKYNSFISRKTGMEVIGYCHLKLARVFHKKNKLKTIKHGLMCLLNRQFFRIKEVLVLIFK